jgi:hypothetical protein
LAALTEQWSRGSGLYHAAVKFASYRRTRVVILRPLQSTILTWRTDRTLNDRLNHSHRPLPGWFRQ